MDQVLTHKECKWVSVTTGDTVYGTEVVNRVLTAHAKQSQESPQIQVDLLLAPFDSKMFADIGAVVILFRVK